MPKPYSTPAPPVNPIDCTVRYIARAWAERMLERYGSANIGATNRRPNVAYTATREVSIAFQGDLLASRATQTSYGLIRVERFPPSTLVQLTQIRHTTVPRQLLIGLGSNEYIASARAQTRPLWRGTAIA